MRKNQRFHRLTAMLLLLCCTFSACAGAETISPTTGLPIPGEPVSPVMVVISQQFDKVKLDGKTVEAPGVGKRQAWGGLDADMVFESQLFQKSDTRLLFLYHDALVKGKQIQAGPVRSLRDVHVKLAAAWHASVVCKASSPYQTPPLDGYRGRVISLYETEIRPYWKVSENHWRQDNASADVTGIFQTQENAPAVPAFWTFDAAAAKSEPYEGEISIQWAGDKLKTSFVYEEGTGLYGWYANGVPMKSWQDLSCTVEEDMKFSNVVFLYAGHTYPTPLLPEINLNGSGPVKVWTRGGCIEGSWREENSSLLLEAKDGQAIPLTPGRTYVAILPAE